MSKYLYFVKEKSSYLSIFYALLVLFFLLPGKTAAQTTQPAFDSRADYAFGQVMNFYLQIENAGSIDHVTLFFRAPEFANTYTAEVAFTPGETVTLSHDIDLTQVRLAPFTTVTFWWLLHTTNGEEMRVPEQTITYEDDQFEWQTLTQGNMIAHWTGDDPALGQLALDIMAETLLRLRTLMPVTEALPLHVYIYPSSADLRAALRLAGRDWVGAHAHPELGVMLVTAVNTRTAAADLRQSIPHEMVHFYLYQATGVAYDTLPAWFNEGLATYMEESPNPGYEALLETAVANQATIPFNELCHTFPAVEEQALLAYAQSDSLIRFIQARYGNQAVRKLVETFADGGDCHSAVSRTLQLSLEELNRDWLRSLQPRSPLVQFLYNNGLWLLLLAGGFGITSLLILNPTGREK